MIYIYLYHPVIQLAIIAPLMMGKNITPKYPPNIENNPNKTYI